MCPAALETQSLSLFCFLRGLSRPCGAAPVGATLAERAGTRMPSKWTGPSLKAMFWSYRFTIEVLVSESLGFLCSWDV